MSWMSRLARDFNDEKWWKYYQKAHRAKSSFFKKWYTLKYMRMASKNGGYVGRETVIMGKPELPHGFHGIHISRRAVIGKDVTILQNVTIGNKNAQGAIIGDGVFIGANAVIIGDVRIGNGAKIGGGVRRCRGCRRELHRGWPESKDHRKKERSRGEMNYVTFCK